MRLIYERVKSPVAVTSYRGTVEVFVFFFLVSSSGPSTLSPPQRVSPVVNAQLEAGIGAGIEGMKADLAKATFGP